MTSEVDELSLVFGALSSSTRRDILTRLSRGPATVNELAAHYPMSRPAISQHLRVLDSAGLIARTASAQWRRCSIREGGFDEASAWIAKQRADWAERFDFLEEHIQQKRRDVGTRPTCRWPCGPDQGDDNLGGAVDSRYLVVSSRAVTESVRIRPS